MRDWDSFKTVRLPLRIEEGQFCYFYGGPMPALDDCRLVELVVPASIIKDEAVRMKLLAERLIPLLAAQSELLVRVCGRNIPLVFARFVLEVRTANDVKTSCVPIRLLDPLTLRWRGSRPSTLQPARVDIPALGATAESVNHAYRLVSEAFEPHRLSHTANVFREVFVRVKNHIVPLERLRSARDASAEPDLILQSGSGKR
jgi:hypothetical protein